MQTVLDMCEWTRCATVLNHSYRTLVISPMKQACHFGGCQLNRCSIVWYLKHDVVLVLGRTAVTACYFTLHQFWHRNILNWKRMSFSWKNFLYNKVSIYSLPNICNDLISLNILIGRSFLFLLPRNYSKVGWVAVKKDIGAYFWHQVVQRDDEQLSLFFSFLVVLHALPVSLHHNVSNYGKN